MALVRWRERGDLNPWSALRDLESQFSRMFNDLGRDLEGGWAPATDLSETEDAYTLHVDVPGMKKEDIDIAVIENLVTIKGERKHEKRTDDEGYHRYERHYGSFQRTVEIPGGFEPDKVDAHYEDGVLTITLPKREEMKPRRIDLKVN